MLYRVIKYIIEKGRIEGLEEKLDILLLANRLTQEEYQTLKVDMTK